MKDRAAYSALCSALDVIGDTELALDSCRLLDLKSAGEKYLYVYGVLQALYLQQDAVAELFKIIIPQKSKTYKRSETIEIVRESRNAAVGHPANRRGEAKSHSIARITLSKEGFQLATYYPDRDSRFERINLPHLIASQQAEHIKVLSEVLEYLEKDEMMHRAKFKNDLLANCFHSSMGYMISKMYEATWSHDKNLGLASLQSIELSLEKFKTKLEERNEYYEGSGSRHAVEDLNYPINEFSKYLNDTSDKLNDKDAYIFVSYIEKKIKEIREICEKIDNEYALKIKNSL